MTTKTIKDLILALDYEKAREQLDAEPSDNEKRLARLEIAFFYNESGFFDQALDVIRDIPVLANHLPDSPAGIRHALSQYDLESYQFFQLRYFPRMLPVAGGSFNFGPFRGEQLVSVTLSDFEMSATPITVWQYAIFSHPSSRNMQEKTPRHGWVGNHPMVHLSWYEVLEYAQWLSLYQNLQPAYKIEKERPDPNNQNKTDKVHWSVRVDSAANGFRLPTEAEWEYAARGGRQSHDFQYAGGDIIQEVAWYSENTKGIQPVSQKQPNELGIYDMSGLVWEWCWDWEGPYHPGSWKNPQGPPQGAYRIMRGGSFRDVDDQSLVINRGSGNPHARDDSYGMRLVRRQE